KRWGEFLSRLDAAHCVQDVTNLLDDKPPAEKPGWRCYANLEYFMKQFSPPAGCTRTEMSLYLQLFRRLASIGEVSQLTKDATEMTLQSAIDGNEPWYK